MLIAIEGIDGTGKTTLANALALALCSAVDATTKTSIGAMAKISVVAEPYDERFKELIGQVADDQCLPNAAKQLALLYAADRLSKPLVGTNEIVITDRSIISSLAYQWDRTAGITLGWLLRINRHVQAPDLIVYLNLDPAIAYGRIVARAAATGKPIASQEQLARLRLTQARYTLMLNKLTNRRRVTVKRFDAGTTPETLLAAVLAYLLPKIQASIKH